MATSAEAKTRLRIKAIADTVSGLSAARNKLGLNDLSADTEFLNTLVSAGPYLIIMPAEPVAYDSTTLLSHFKVELVLWIGAANNADNDYTAIEDLFATLRTAIMNRANYTTVCPPQDMTDISREVRTDLTPNAITYKMEIAFIG